jgi:hypothetical protein
LVVLIVLSLFTLAILVQLVIARFKLISLGGYAPSFESDFLFMCPALCAAAFSITLIYLRLHESSCTRQQKFVLFVSLLVGIALLTLVSDIVGYGVANKFGWIPG